MLDKRERLECFAKAHVIGEDPAEPERIQQREELEALALIGAQLRVQPGWNGRMWDGLEFLQFSDGCLPTIGSLGRVCGVGEILPKTHLILRDLLAFGLPLGEGLPLGDQGAQGIEGRVLKRKIGAILEKKFRLALRERHKKGRERDRSALERDLEAQVEPVVLRGILGLPHAHRRGAVELAVGVACARDGDIDAVHSLERG